MNERLRVPETTRTGVHNALCRPYIQALWPSSYRSSSSSSFWADRVSISTWTRPGNCPFKNLKHQSDRLLWKKKLFIFISRHFSCKATSSKTSTNFLQIYIQSFSQALQPSFNFASTDFQMIVKKVPCKSVLSQATNRLNRTMKVVGSVWDQCHANVAVKLLWTRPTAEGTKWH